MTGLGIAGAPCCFLFLFSSFVSQEEPKKEEKTHTITRTSALGHLLIPPSLPPSLPAHSHFTQRGPEWPSLPPSLFPFLRPIGRGGWRAG